MYRLEQKAGRPEMSGQKFKEEEIQRLNELPCIEKATDKLLIFKQSFKREAVEKRKEGYTANQIFTEAGIDISKYAPKYFHHLLKRWRHENLSDDVKRGRPKKTVKGINEMSLDELKARVAYLEAENDFLKKLKALEQGAKLEDLL